MLVYILYGVVIIGGVIWWKNTRNKSKQSYLIPGVPKGTVVLHQYGPAPFVPSISPFVMKLETYLRVAKIPYVNQYDRKPGPKGKLPWIQYNDEVIPDSQAVIEFLNEEFKVDLNKKLANEQKAMGHVLRRMAEEWLYWVLVMWRVVFETNGTVYRLLGLPAIIIWYMRRAARPRLVSQGIGRHSKQEVTQMLTQDLDAIDSILGDKKYIFGESPDDVTEFDCAIFGQLCQLTWQMPDCGVEELIEEKYPRLVSYCLRMKADFWPDWDERLKKPSSTNNSKTTSTTSSSSSSKSSPSSLSSSSSKSSTSATLYSSGVLSERANGDVLVTKETNDNDGVVIDNNKNNDSSSNNNKNNSNNVNNSNNRSYFNHFSNNCINNDSLASSRKRLIMDQGIQLS